MKYIKIFEQKSIKKLEKEVNDYLEAIEKLTSFSIDSTIQMTNSESIATILLVINEKEPIIYKIKEMENKSKDSNI